MLHNSESMLLLQNTGSALLSQTRILPTNQTLPEFQEVPQTGWLSLEEFAFKPLFYFKG